MKKYLFILPLYLVSSFLPSFAQQKLHLMSFNIRLETTSDGVNQWQNRKDYVASTIAFHSVDICGLQEAFIGQIKDILVRVPNYDFVGKGRDDGAEKGEFSCILYRKDRIKVLNSGTFWLSETPEKPGFGWDAKHNRVVTWLHGQEKKTGKQFYVFNTHFDHQGVVARRESARLLKKKITEIAGNKPTVVLGDFNAEITQEPLVILTDASVKPVLRDSKILSETPHFGPNGTFTGFKEAEVTNEAIDHILVTSDWKVWKHATFSHTWHGRFASDHFAVYAEIWPN